MVEIPPMLPVFLLLTTISFQGTLLQSGITEQRKPFFERFRRLEEQFRRFQEVTLLRLQEIAEHYNVSYNINARFEHLQSKCDSLVSTVNVTHAAMQEELRLVKNWMKKLQNKSKKQGSKITALERSLHDRDHKDTEAKEQQSSLLANFTQDFGNQRAQAETLATRFGALQKTLESLQDALKNQGTKVNELEQQLKIPGYNGILLPSHLAAPHLLNQVPQETEPVAAGGQSPTLKKLRAKHRQRKKLQEESSRLMAHFQSRRLQNGSHLGQNIPLQETVLEHPPHPELQALRQPPTVMVKTVEELELSKVTQRPGTICNVDTMLVFPNASTDNFAAFGPGFHTALLELSLCTWVRTRASYLGTIFSYATQENDNKLVLHGRDAAPRNSIHFVIGDPAFRELPVGWILDGEWHHICVIWSSIEGRYWFYIDRRLASMGSRFQKGYEIPPKGSLILGQEQDVLGGGFEPSESFVGFLAGFAMWDRVLSPGEVSGVATGKGLPRGIVLTLANASVAGSVQKVPCACLEHCL
uniref:Pentraxin 4 n=1 Tax=Salvator merianae TaxID=96440 RepID=A0A8D0AXY3_SALMN